MIKVKNIFEIGDLVATKSNGKSKVVAISTITTEKGTLVRYLLEGFKFVLYYEEDLKLIKRKEQN